MRTPPPSSPRRTATSILGRRRQRRPRRRRPAARQLWVLRPGSTWIRAMQQRRELRPALHAPAPALALRLPSVGCHAARFRGWAVPLAVTSLLQSQAWVVPQPAPAECRSQRWLQRQQWQHPPCGSRRSVPRSNWRSHAQVMPWCSLAGLLVLLLVGTSAVEGCGCCRGLSWCSLTWCTTLVLARGAAQPASAAAVAATVAAPVCAGSCGCRCCRQPLRSAATERGCRCFC